MPLQKQYQSHDGFNYRLLGKLVDLSPIMQYWLQTRFLFVLIDTVF
jgi:hypothetical protein